jgi:hypothetical protein
VKCYRHGGNEFNLRARLEDLLELEKKRTGKRFARSDTPMKFAEASRLLNASILVVRILGCAWRWAEWWVDYNSTWEPLLEPDEREEDMTAEQLRIVKSTRESRCDDARKCRLAALGAALRSRKYDTEDGFDRNALSRALRAVLRTKSLVGPLNKSEIDFFVDWLGRAYRSKSHLLGLGEDSILVARKGCCLHIQDQSPKFELGLRSVPGTQEPNASQAFEIDTNDIDDFLQTEVVTDEVRITPRRQRNSQQVSSASASSGGPGRKRSRGPADSASKSIMSAAIAVVGPSAVKKRPGRPPGARNRSPSVASSGRKRAGRPPRIRNDAGSSIQDPSEQGAIEANAEMKPRKKRRGRPPKIRPPAEEPDSVTQAAVEQAARNALEQEREGSDAEPQRSGKRRGRRSSTEQVTETALPPTAAPTSEPPKKRRAGRPPKMHHSPLDPLPSPGSTSQGVTDFVQEGGRSESSRGRPQRSRRPIESYDPASLPAKQKLSAESDPPKKRRGRPPKVRQALESTLPAASTAESDAASVEQAEPSSDHSVETSLAERGTEAVSPVTETATNPAIAAPLRLPKRKAGRPKRHREEVDPAIDDAIAESADDPPIESALAEAADMSDIASSPSSLTRKRGRPKRPGQEVMPGAVNPVTSKFDVIKRRRHPTLSTDKVKNKSYDTDSSDATATDDDTSESPKRRKRALSEDDDDDLPIADLVANKRGLSRDRTRKRGRKSAAATSASTAASMGEQDQDQDQKPAASMLVDTSTSILDQMSLESNEKVQPPPPSEDASTDTEISTDPLSEQLTPAKDDSTALSADGEADTPSKRGRRRGKKEAARTMT